MAIRLVRDYYGILGIARNATAEEIKKAYRRLAFKNHPDLNDEYGAEEKIKEINKAYEVLGKPKKKAAYDARLFSNIRTQPAYKPNMPPRAATIDQNELIRVMMQKDSPWWAKVSAFACLFADIYFKTKESYRGAKPL